MLWKRKQLCFLLILQKIFIDKLGIWIEDVDINDFLMNILKDSNHKIAQLSVQESFFSNEREK